jgi:hypothetical protein
VIAESYQELTMQLNSLLDEIKWNCWLQQDHATAHMINSTTEMLAEFVTDDVTS